PRHDFPEAAHDWSTEASHVLRIGFQPLKAPIAMADAHGPSGYHLWGDYASCRVSGISRREAASTRGGSKGQSRGGPKPAERRERLSLNQETAFARRHRVRAEHQDACNGYDWHQRGGDDPDNSTPAEFPKGRRAPDRIEHVQ